MRHKSSLSAGILLLSELASHSSEPARTCVENPPRERSQKKTDECSLWSYGRCGRVGAVARWGAPVPRLRPEQRALECPRQRRGSRTRLAHMLRMELDTFGIGGHRCRIRRSSFTKTCSVPFHLPPCGDPAAPPSVRITSLSAQRSTLNGLFLACPVFCVLCRQTSCRHNVSGALGRLLKPLLILLTRAAAGGGSRCLGVRDQVAKERPMANGPRTSRGFANEPRSCAVMKHERHTNEKEGEGRGRAASAAATVFVCFQKCAPT
jgi:hypothetical protein